MSDPVSNVEIEDVLSSIRRLVSEDARPRPEPRPAYSDKLVLTPALRVSDEQLESLPVAAETPAADEDHDMSEGDGTPLVLGENLATDASLAADDAAYSLHTPGADEFVLDFAQDDPAAPEQSPVGAQAAAEHIKADVVKPAATGAFVLSDALRNMLPDEDPVDENVAELEGAAEPDAGEDPLTDLTKTAVEDDASFDAALASFIEADAEHGQIVDDAAPQEPDAAMPEAEDLAPAADRPAGSITTQSILSQLVEQEVSRALNEGFDDALYEDAGPKSPMPPTFEDMEAAEGTDPQEAADKPEVEPILARRAAHLSLVTSLFDAGPSQSDLAEQDEQDHEPESEDHADAAAQTAAEDVVPEAELIEETATITASQPDGDTLEQKIAQLESLVAARDDSSDIAEGPDAFDLEDLEPVAQAQDIEDAEFADDDVSGTPFFHRSATLDWQDAEPEPDQPVAAKDPEGPAPVQAPALDEAALRDMVADIIREELKGVLGERITRNVRKLVRREIHRVITSQELD